MLRAFLDLVLYSDLASFLREWTMFCDYKDLLVTEVRVFKRNSKIIIAKWRNLNTSRTCLALGVIFMLYLLWWLTDAYLVCDHSGCISSCSALTTGKLNLLFLLL